MNLSKSGLKQFELVIEGFFILLHAAYLSRFLLRICFPDLMEVRADIRGEMHYAGWGGLNYGPCYWIDLARHWIPANLTVCTHSSVPSSDSEDFVPAFRLTTVLFVSTTFIHCFILLYVMVKNGHGKLPEYHAFYKQVSVFLKARVEPEGPAMVFVCVFLSMFCVTGPYWLVCCGIWSIQRFGGDSAVLPGGTLLLLCLMFCNILGLLGVWNIRSRYEQVATLLRLPCGPRRSKEARRSRFHPEGMRLNLFQSVIASVSRLLSALMALSLMGFHLRLDYPGASGAFSTGWWTGMMRRLQTPVTGLEMLRMNDARLSHWYNITEKYANPSLHPGLTDPISPLASFIGSFGWYLSELCVWCFFSIFTMSILGFVTSFSVLVAREIREYFFRQQSRQYIAADEGHLHGPLAPLSDRMVVRQLLMMYTMLFAPRLIWTSFVLTKVVLLLVPERLNLPVHLLYMLWLMWEAVRAGRSLKKSRKAFKDYMNAQDVIWA